MELMMRIFYSWAVRLLAVIAFMVILTMDGLDKMIVGWAAIGVLAFAIYMLSLSDNVLKRGWNLAVTGTLAAFTLFGCISLFVMCWVINPAPKDKHDPI